MTAAPVRVRQLARVLLVLGVLALFAVPVAIPQAAAGEPGSARFLQIRVDRVTPDIVTTAGEPVVTVSGVVRNVGDRPVRDVVVRLEAAAAVTTSAGLRTNLTGPVDQFEPIGGFTTLSAELERGQEVPFTLSYPLRSSTQPSFDIHEPGVYPVMVNVNGTPDYGAPARLDDARFLLPVLGVPRDPADDSDDTVSTVVPPDTSRPVGITLLWPLADRPRLAAGAPGGTTPVRLLDDELATALAPGGRLDVLLSAIEFATGSEVDPRGDIRTSTCLAVDPDLLVTVNAMTGGYVVNDGPDAGPGTPTRPGTGQEAATAWLNRLKGLAQRMCVVSSTYAQADLDALRRVGDPGLSAIATLVAGDIVDQILSTASVRGATLLADGPVSGPAVELLSSQGHNVAIGAANVADRHADGESSGNGGGEGAVLGADGPVDLRPVRYTAEVVAAPFDPAVGAALAGIGTDPVTPSYLDPALALPLHQDSEVARRQSGLGALLWRTLLPGAEPRTEILMPPLVWSPRPDDAHAVLTAVRTAITARLARPRPLTEVINDANAAPAGPLAPLPPADLGDPQARIDDAVVAGIAAVTGRLWGLTAALTTDVRTGLTGQAYTAPLREDMLRALSQSVPPEARNGLAQQRLSTVTRTVDNLFNAVTVVNPGGSYTLATERSPLPLALRNDLAVPIRVRLDVQAPPGMTVSDIGEIELPPGYLPVLVPIEVHFTQRVAVDVGLRTADGLPLGEPVRLSVHSNAYGKVLFFITLSAGAVLVLLAGRRLWHRFRGQPDPADLDRPDPLDVALSFDPDAEPGPAGGNRAREDSGGPDRTRSRSRPT